MCYLPLELLDAITLLFGVQVDLQTVHPVVGGKPDCDVGLFEMTRKRRLPGIWQSCNDD